MAIPRVFIPLFLAVAALLITAAASYSIASSRSGNGKYDVDGDGLIEVSNLEQLNAIRYDLNGDGQADADSGKDAYAAAFPVSGSETVCNRSCNGYELARSLDFDGPRSYASNTVNLKWTSGDGWLPIGNENNRLGANFNGNGHTISNLYINRTTQFNNPGAVGLFGYSGGQITNVGVVDIDVTGLEFVGGLVGRGSTIRDSYATGNVSGESSVGGLVGSSGGTISNSYSASNVLGENRVGGLVGRSDGTISNSYAIGNVSGNNIHIGGLVGYSAFTISNSYATGNVSGEGSVGGLAGGGGGIISSSYATGNVSGEYIIGGLVGGGSTTISSSYATGNVSGEYNIGGLVGGSSGTIASSYAVSRVSGESSVGGLVGYARGITVIGGYWDTQTSGQTTSAAGEGKTTAELQSTTSYTGAFAAWHIDLDNADQDFDQSTGIDDVWDFGTSNQYPAVKADFNGDGVATWQEFGNQRPQSPTARPTAASTPTSTAGAVDSNARPSAEVFGELFQAGLLVSVWRYDNATQSWDAYDPNVPAELNDLTHAAPKDIVWVQVKEETQFQGGTLRKGWNLISLK